MVNKIIPSGLKKIFIKQHYKIVGNHSAVKLCFWLRKSIRDMGFCYKQKFYPEYVRSHQCLQMSVSACWCTNRCIMCWRAIENTLGNTMDGIKIDEPKNIIGDAIKAQKSLLNGFPGWEGTDMKKWKEAQSPKNVALSLIGENLLYPKISELIEEFHKRKIITFLVTNGQLPERLENMKEPTQLYISLDAPDSRTHLKLDRPGLPDSWERLNSSLELMNSLSCRKVIRLTLVKGWNMKDPRGYAKLIQKANPDFIEVKGFIHIGQSQRRLPREAMPLHQEVREFAGKLSKESGYPLKDEQEVSRVVLLSGK